MGYLNQKSERVQEAIREVEKIVAKSGKFMGTIANNAQEAKILYDRGYNYIIMMSDMVSLADAAKHQVEEFRRLCL